LGTFSFLVFLCCSLFFAFSSTSSCLVFSPPAPPPSASLNCVHFPRCLYKFFSFFVPRSPDPAPCTCEFLEKGLAPHLILPGHPLAGRGVFSCGGFWSLRLCKKAVLTSRPLHLARFFFFGSLTSLILFDLFICNSQPCPDFFAPFINFSCRIVVPPFFHVVVFFPSKTWFFSSVPFASPCPAPASTQKSWPTPIRGGIVLVCQAPKVLSPLKRMSFDLYFRFFSLVSSFFSLLLIFFTSQYVVVCFFFFSSEWKLRYAFYLADSRLFFPPIFLRSSFLGVFQ